MAGSEAGRLPEPEQRLPHTADPGERLEHKRGRVLNTLVRVFLDAPIARLDVADRQTQNERAPPGLGEQPSCPAGGSRLARPC
jgi:hypothetical protein